MKNIVFLVALAGILLGCDPSKNKVDPDRHYPDVARLNVQFALFDPRGTRIDVSGQSRSESKQYKLNAGQYRVVVTSDRRAVGKFDLVLVGTKAGAIRVHFESLQSGSQTWGALGGGGSTKTFKNHFYTFDVTKDNFSADITLESADPDVELVVYDPLGQVLASDFFNSRYRFKVLSLKKGTYTVMAATDQRGSVGNYQLTVVGQQDFGRYVHAATDPELPTAGY